MQESIEVEIQEAVDGGHYYTMLERGIISRHTLIRWWTRYLHRVHRRAQMDPQCSICVVVCVVFLAGLAVSGSWLFAILSRQGREGRRPHWPLHSRMRLSMLVRVEGVLKSLLSATARGSKTMRVEEKTTSTVERVAGYRVDDVVCSRRVRITWARASDAYPGA